ncbi:DNA primase family protein [Mesomycoplasma molare]|uniref:Phage/plasmid primase, P4 family n=1 Tax=Mesomycoplasma molare TaxID=171288 RepID=A0ABY5TTP4_9BACT|nr:phage/plasmid primase, P4 family [Mesomycoplasma molare]UWD34042.1 phage/plasmid primase, P4 family [Mesomycoplasma molare]
MNEKEKNLIDKEALNNFFNNECEFIILNNDKTPKHSFKGGKNLYRFEEVKSEQNLGIYLQDNWVVLDIDNKDNPLSSKKLIEIIDDFGWQCNIMKTDRGHHLWFKLANELKNAVDIVLPFGIKADVKASKNNGYVVIKKDGSFRQWIRFFKSVDLLPSELTPLDNKDAFKDLASPVLLEEGSRRDNLFQRIKTFALAGWDRTRTFNVLSAINKFLFLKPLDEYEVENCFLGSEQFFEKYKNRYVFHNGREFLHLNFINFLIEEYKLKRYSKQLFVFDKEEEIYKRADDNFLMGLMLKENKMLKKAQLSEVLNHLKVTTAIPEKEPEKNIVALKNTYYNLETYRKIKPDDKYFVISKINVEYNRRYLRTETIDKFFNNITLNDKQLINILYEYIGYCLTPDTRYQKSLLLYGPTASNGKSTFLEVLTNFFSVENVSFLSFEELNGRFSTSTLIDKMVNIGADISTDHIKDPSKFKKLSSGDNVEAEFKGKDMFSFKNKAKLIFAANKLPTTSEKSYGYFRRFLIVPFDAEFKGNNDDKNVLDKLLTKNNMNVLFNYAIEGLKRLREKGGFTESDKVNDILTEYERNNNSVVLYLENSVQHSEEEIKAGLNIHDKAIFELYLDYKQYCGDFGYKALSLVKFKEEIMLYYKKIRLTTIRILENGIFKEKFLVTGGKHKKD